MTAGAFSYHRGLAVVGAILAGTSVALGAFGAHALRSMVADPHALEVFKTGAQYQMAHALGVLILSFFAGTDRRFLMTALIMVVGVVLFSGSLYLMVLLDQRSLGVVTPLGGLCFLIGWSKLVINIAFQKRIDSK